MTGRGEEKPIEVLPHLGRKLLRNCGGGKANDLSVDVRKRRWNPAFIFGEAQGVGAQVDGGGRNGRMRRGEKTYGLGGRKKKTRKGGVKMRPLLSNKGDEGRRTSALRLEKKKVIHVCNENRKKKKLSVLDPAKGGQRRGENDIEWGGKGMVVLLEKKKKKALARRSQKKRGKSWERVI